MIKFNQMLPVVSASRSDFPRNFMLGLPSKQSVKRSDWLRRKGSLFLKRLSLLRRAVMSRSFIRYGIAATLIGTTAAMIKIFRRADTNAVALESDDVLRDSNETSDTVAARVGGASDLLGGINVRTDLLNAPDSLARAMKDYFHSISGVQGSRTYNEEYDDLKFAEVVDALSEVITSIAYTRGCQPATLQSAIAYSLYSSVPVGRKMRKLVDDIEKDASLAHLNSKAMCAQINLMNAMTSKLFKV